MAEILLAELTLSVTCRRAFAYRDNDVAPGNSPDRFGEALGARRVLVWLHVWFSFFVDVKSERGGYGRYL